VWLGNLDSKSYFVWILNFLGINSKLNNYSFEYQTISQNNVSKQPKFTKCYLNEIVNNIIEFWEVLKILKLKNVI
jgi:hypothetical protein